MGLVLSIALAGGLGTLARYGLSGLIQRITGAGFPFGTMTINILGCFAIGMIMYLALNTDLIPAGMRIVVTIGFLGGFTTFSSFSYESVKLLEDGAFTALAFNIAGNVVLGMGATLLGTAAGKMVLGGL